MSTRSVFVQLCALGLIIEPTLIYAQRPAGHAPRFPATVVLVDNLPVPGASFVVTRRPDLTPADLILVHANTTPAQLSDAVRTLLAARQASGDVPITQATIRMRPQQQSQRVRKDFPWVPRVLADLRKAGGRTIPGVGRARAVDILLPSQAPKGGQLGAKERRPR